MSVAAALVNANLYYNQPLLADMARTFGVSAGEIGWVAMLTQAGCACGLIFIAPLGDAVDRRRLLLTLCFLAVAGTAAVALAPTMLTLAAASFALGIASIAPQLLLPFAAHLARPGEQGRALGIVMGGIVVGILMGRTVSGYVGQRFGWRAMYWIATVALLGIALVLRSSLPHTKPITRLSYGRLLLSLRELVVQEPILRETIVVGALLFAAYNAFWATLVFRLEAAPFFYDSRVAGLFGLMGVVGIAGVRVAGRLADRSDPRRLCLGLTLAATIGFLVLASLGNHLYGLFLGALVLDASCNSGSTTCHARNYRALPNAMNRAATLYISSVFFGGALGTRLGIYAWERFGYGGVCVTGGAMLLGALLMLLRPAPGNGRAAAFASVDAKEGSAGPAAVPLPPND